MNAIKSRVQSLHYDATDKQIVALMKDICKNGHVDEKTGQRMVPNTCRKVCDFLLERCVGINIRPEVRMLVEKAYPDFLLWKSGNSETHWKDLINSALEQRLVELKHPVDIHVPSKKEEEAAELELLEKICQEFTSPEDRLRAFMEQTERSKRT